MIAAILRAQFLSMRFGGITFSWIARIVWYGIWTVVAVAAYLLAANIDAARLHGMLPWAFLAICGYWQMMPIVSASMGAGLDLRKLMVYPVPHRKLFLVEVLLRFTSGAEMLLVLAGMMGGLAANAEAGGWTKVPRLLAVAVIFVLFNVLLASGTRSILERLLARRKVREVMAVLMAMIWVLPRFLISTGFRPKFGGTAGAAIGLLALPWSAAARAALPLQSGQPEWLALLGLSGWTLLAFWFGRRQFERSLRYDAIAAQSSVLRPRDNRRSWTEWFYRLPGVLWRDPLAAIAEKELRSLSRTPRFRMVFVMGFTFGLLVWFPMIVTHRPGRSTEPSPYFLLIVCLYALTLLGQVSYWNCFGFDRSATALYFAAPVKISKVLIGKNLGVAVLYLPGGSHPDERDFGAAFERGVAARRRVAARDGNLFAVHSCARKPQLRALSARAEPGARLARRIVGQIPGPGFSSLPGYPAAGRTGLPRALCLQQRADLRDRPHGRRHHRRGPVFDVDGKRRV